MPEIHVDIIVSKFTCTWLLKLLTKQFFHLFIWLQFIFAGPQLLATKSVFINTAILTNVIHLVNPKGVGVMR